MLDQRYTDLYWLDTDIPSKHVFCFQDVWRRLQGMSSRLLQDMSLRLLQDMFSRRLEDVFSATIFCLPRPLEDAFKTSCKISLRRLERRKIVTVKTCLSRLQDVLRDVLRRLEDVLKDEKLLPWRRVEEFFKTCLEDVLKTNKCLLGCWFLNKTFEVIHITENLHITIIHAYIEIT